MTYDIKLQFYNGVNQISLNDNLTLFDLADGGYIPGTFVYSRFTGVGTGGSILSSGSDGIIGFVEPETGGRLVTFSNQDLFREALYQNPGDGDLGRLLFNSLNYLAGYPRSVDSDQRVNILNLGETMTGYAYKYKNARQFEHSPHNGHSVKITSFNWEKPSRDIGALNGANILLDAIGPEANWSESVDLVIIDTSATKEQLDVITEWMKRTDGGVLVALNSSIIKDTLSEFLTYYGLAVSPSSGPPIDVYTPDKILGTSGLIETYGNTSPIIDNKTINLLEEFVHVPYSELALTEEAAAQAAALFLRIKTASGENLNGLEYIELEQATSLVNLAEILSTTINAHLPDQYSISVTYDETRNVIQLEQIYTGGEDLTFSDFVLAKQAEREPTDLGQLISVFNGTFSNNPGTAVASTATWSIPVEQKDIVTRINLSLRDSHGTEFNFRDFPLYRYGNIDIGNVDDRFSNISFDEVLDASGSNYLITVTDTLGRDIVDFSLMDLSSYDPLMHAVVEDGDATGNIKLGAISGKIDATDPEGKQITYNLVGKPSFGSVVIDNNTGNYVYVPDPDVFNGYDQFHITVSDGLNESGPAALQIISETQYIESNPSIVEIAFDDPYYEERLADYSVPIPNDFTLEDVFFAQVHVQRPNDPYLALTSDRWVQLKFNATSVSSSAAPEFEVAVYDINGKKLGQRLFSGPELLPAEVDLPSDHNLADLDRGHRLDDSYVVPIPGNWVQPGVTFQLIINGEPYSLGSLNYGLQREAEGILSPKVGGGAIINLSMEHYGLGAGKDLITLEGGLTSIGEELLAKTTFAWVRLFNFPGERLEKAIQDNDLYGFDSNLRAYQLFTGDKDNLQVLTQILIGMDLAVLFPGH